MRVASRLLRYSHKTLGRQRSGVLLMGLTPPERVLLQKLHPSLRFDYLDTHPRLRRAQVSQAWESLVHTGSVSSKRFVAWLKLFDQRDLMFLAQITPNYGYAAVNKLLLAELTRQDRVACMVGFPEPDLGRIEAKLRAAIKGKLPLDEATGLWILPETD